jgi:hypothetical protein
MDSLTSNVPQVINNEDKLIKSFPESRVAIQTFFSENKAKEKYMVDTFTVVEDGLTLFDLKKISDISDKLDDLTDDYEAHIDYFSDEEIDKINEFSKNRVCRTNVNKILTLLSNLFPGGVNVKWVDYSCNNFSTDEVGCDLENEMLRALLRHKKSDENLNFGGSIL